MGKSFYWWSGSKPRERERRRKGPGVGPGWEPITDMEVRPGFLANYGLRVAMSLLTCAFSLFVLVAVGDDFFYLGGGAPWYFFLCGSGIVMGSSLPFFWYDRHRQMLHIYDDATPVSFYDRYRSGLLVSATIMLIGWPVTLGVLALHMLEGPIYLETTPDLGLVIFACVVGTTLLATLAPGVLWIADRLRRRH